MLHVSQYTRTAVVSTFRRSLALSRYHHLPASFSLVSRMHKGLTSTPLNLQSAWACIGSPAGCRCLMALSKYASVTFLAFVNHVHKP